MGWLVDVVEKTGRFVKVKDCFGLFDLLAVNNKSVALVQVSSNVPHTHKYLMEFKGKYPIVNVVQYVKKDRKGIDCYYYYANDYVKSDCEVDINGKEKSC